MALTLSLLSSVRNQKANHYLMDESHTGQISALWFDQEEDKFTFLKSLATLSLREEIAVLDIQGKEVKQIQKSANDLINQNPQIIVLEGEHLSEEIQEVVMQLNGANRSSIFLINGNLPTMFIADKVICVGKNGQVTDEFLTDVFN